MTPEKIKRPRCPKCNRLQADWVTEAKFTCPKCSTEFAVGPGYLTIFTPMRFDKDFNVLNIGDGSKVVTWQES